MKRRKVQKMRLAAVLAAVCLLAAGCGGAAQTVGTAETGLAEPGQTESESVETGLAEVKLSEAEPSEQETAAPVAVVQEGMTPVPGSELKDGTYPIQVDSSSSMFRITSCELTVKDGDMRAVMTMGGTGYLKLYMGTGAEAEKASEADYIPFVENEKGEHTFAVPVEALDMGIDCSAFSKNKESWYDRVLVFRADSLPMDAFAEGNTTSLESLGLEDGAYTVEVTLEGGSGRAFVESPAKLRVEDQKAYAVIIWSSANFDYMKVDGEKFELLSTEGNSAFEIPVTVFDRRMPVLADTIAMSVPHEVEYTLTFDSTTLKKAE